jgi:periplasmic protein TonB
VSASPRVFSALGTSITVHVLIGAAAVLLVRHAPAVVSAITAASHSLPGVVWLDQPGPGGGGGGGGNRSPEPAGRLEVRGRDAVSMPASAPPPAVPPRALPPVDAPSPDTQIVVPIAYSGASLDTRPGVLDGRTGNSLGPGSGGGAGGGRGPGLGNGEGPGIGDGRHGGFGGADWAPGSGVESPRPVRIVKPNYTADAMRAHIQGEAWVECVVLPDGTVTRARIVRSLDGTFGLDEEALRAAVQWRFIPGRRLGQPVAVRITIAIEFHLT